MLSPGAKHGTSDTKAPPHSDVDDPDAYGYSVLAVPETIAVPYKLSSGKTKMTAKPLLKPRKLSLALTPLS
ncbi:hypothetical protein DSO57_1021153 [Entomophthora muscae]|uniref:Uncharacterized protein n=1 Tax=Entomophthora muscae TaxID=34485 RepID=A0ACC2TR25_9FUNG|nr:hypothetical protein DSO57_1021153 [Entomophthora muscae]